MNREGHENTAFFYGIEVEHTLALGKKTLFVVGVQTTDDIAASIRGSEHIYFGANQSFPNIGTNDYVKWTQWEDMIGPFLDRGYLCTLDIDVQCVEGLLESGLTEHHNFIPMISVKLPYIRQLGYNATLKLDDRDFAATNPGVWCHSLHELRNRAVFTDWSKYTQDKVIT
jgi:hypothetical protein